MNNVIKLIRQNRDTEVTLGKMIFPNGKTFCTIELPWKDNQRSISCIPDGNYVLRKRDSAIVSRTSKQRYQKGWEVTDVPNRTFIMIHIGNTVKDFEGCIGVGTDYGVIGGHKGVINSRVAFDEFMEEMEAFDEWTLEIEWE